MAIAEFLDHLDEVLKMNHHYLVTPVSEEVLLETQDKMREEQRTAPKDEL